MSSLSNIPPIDGLSDPQNRALCEILLTICPRFAARHRETQELRTTCWRQGPCTCWSKVASTYTVNCEAGDRPRRGLELELG